VQSFSRTINLSRSDISRSVIDSLMSAIQRRHQHPITDHLHKNVSLMALQISYNSQSCYEKRVKTHVYFAGTNSVLAKWTISGAYDPHAQVPMVSSTDDVY
jgi:hypothetical protein